MGELIDKGPLKGLKISAVKHLDDSARSIVNNIAAGVRLITWRAGGLLA